MLHKTNTLHLSRSKTQKFFSISLQPTNVTWRDFASSSLRIPSRIIRYVSQTKCHKCATLSESKTELKSYFAIILLTIHSAIRYVDCRRDCLHHFRQIACLEYRLHALDYRAHLTLGTTVLLQDVGRQPLMVNAFGYDKIFHWPWDVLAAVVTPYRAQFSASLPLNLPLAILHLQRMTRISQSDTRSRRSWGRCNRFHRRANAPRIRRTSPCERIHRPLGYASVHFSVKPDDSASQTCTARRRYSPRHHPLPGPWRLPCAPSSESRRCEYVHISHANNEVIPLAQRNMTRCYVSRSTTRMRNPAWSSPALCARFSRT